jgi:hypothetical protein
MWPQLAQESRLSPWVTPGATRAIACRHQSMIDVSSV